MGSPSGVGSLRTGEMATAETKIFSVAVSQGKAENSSNMMRNVVMKDVERQPVNRPVTLLPSSRPEIHSSGERPEITPSDEEFKPVQRDVEDAPGCVESLDMTDELESALSQTAETTGEEEVKKTKKNKKKKNNNNSENNVDSSADDFKEVEVKPKNKKQANVEEKEKDPEPAPVMKKEKTPEPEIKEKTPENDQPPQPVPRKLKNKKKEEEEKAKKEEEQLTDEFVGFESEEVKFEGFERSKSQESFIPVESPTVEESATAMFEEFSKKSPPTKDNVSPNRDLVEFSEEESVVRVIEAEEEEAEEEDKVEFFIKEKSSSVEPDNDMTSSGIDPMAARPNPWFEKFLKKGSSMIEDQIFGAVKKYEDMDEKGSEDEGMEELENNQADTEKNIADLLEDDEDLIEPTPPPPPQIIESQPPSSNLSQLLKGESSKKAHVDDSSDDDFMFRPVPQQKKSKKQKKQKGQVLSLEEFHRAASQPRETDSGSVADSESEKVSDQEGLSANQGTSKDGWSFEVDEEDVNKLLETEETEVGVSVEQGSEERTDLEDVFRFDSEMHEDEEDEEAAAQVGEQREFDNKFSQSPKQPEQEQEQERQKEEEMIERRQSR